MENLNEKAIKVLNELIVINNDRVDGYNTAAKETQEADLKTLFTTLAGQSSTYRSELSKKVLELGGQPADGTTNSGNFTAPG